MRTIRPRTVRVEMTARGTTAFLSRSLIEPTLDSWLLLLASDEKEQKRREVRAARRRRRMEVSPRMKLLWSQERRSLKRRLQTFSAVPLQTCQMS